MTKSYVFERPWKANFLYLLLELSSYIKSEQTFRPTGTEHIDTGAILDGKI